MFKLSHDTVDTVLIALRNQIRQSILWRHNLDDKPATNMEDALERFRDLETFLVSCLSRFNVVAAIVAIDDELKNMDTRNWYAIRDNNEFADMFTPMIERRLQAARLELWFSMGDNMRRQFTIV